MPKTDTPASRRSARIATASAGPASSAAVAAASATKAAPKAKPASEPVKAKKPASKPASKPKAASKPASKDKAAAPAKVASKKAAKPLSKVEETKDATAAAAEEDAPATNGDAAANGDKPQKVKAPSSGGRALKLGQGLPAITLQDNTGADVDVAELAGEKGVVIFLYPRADTPGCTNQACGFRDIHDDIAAFGYDIYGLSKDKPAAQQKWITKKELNYKLLCDPESKLIKKLGAFVLPNNTKRSHFIFEKGTGALVDIALGVKPADDPTNVLKFLKAHHK